MYRRNKLRLLDHDYFMLFSISSIYNENRAISLQVMEGGSSLC